MKRNHKVGVLVAFRDDEEFVRIGWSALNTKSADVFDKSEGIALAKTTAHKYITGDVLKSTPTIVKKHLPKFIDRCQRYFKQQVLMR